MLSSGEQRGTLSHLLEARLPEPPCPSLLLDKCLVPSGFPGASQERPKHHPHNERQGLGLVPDGFYSFPTPPQERGCSPRSPVLRSPKSPALVCWCSLAAAPTRTGHIGALAGLVPWAARFGQTAEVLPGGWFVFEGWHMASCAWWKVAFTKAGCRRESGTVEA